VPERASSASARIVTAGTRNRSSQGRKSSIGRSVATPYNSIWRKHRKSFTATNTTSRM